MTALDNYRTDVLQEAQRKYFRVLRRHRQITLAAVLCVAFDEFHHTSVLRNCVNAKTTYIEAEEMADFFGGLFDMDIPTEAFLPNDRQYDEAIDHYRKYCEHRKVMKDFGYEENDLDAFCNMVEHKAWEAGLNDFYTFNSIGFMYAMVSVYDYISGAIAFERLKEMMVVFIPPDITPMTERQVRLFARTMFRLVKEFEEVVEKRAKRREKQNNVNADNLVLKRLDNM